VQSEADYQETIAEHKMKYDRHISEFTYALLQLTAVYYVFDIQWCKKVFPTLRFIRAVVMKLEDDVPTQNISLALFVCQFKEM
jgi:hypothetical protein